MSEAIIATDTQLERQVVVKRIADGIEEKRLIDELHALQAIRSPHVVQIYDIVLTKGGKPEALVEEYLPGSDLCAVKPPATADAFLRIAYPVFCALSEIHSHGVVHRDIKRQNMKFDAEGYLKVFDFGLARMADASSTVGEVGTPGYMAPELFVADEDGEVAFTDAVDVYAAACTLLAVCLGTLPKAMCSMPPKLPCSQADFGSLGLGLAKEVSTTLNLCFSADPSDRPSAAEVMSLLSAQLLRDRHRALIVSDGSSYVLDRVKRTVNVGAGALGKVTITYDGLAFRMSNINGAVAVNNIPAIAGAVLPGSCVIVLGAGRRRHNVTVDVAPPEVIL